jgi:hypothetical protein
MYVSSCGVYRIVLSTSEVFSIIFTNFILLIIDMRTTAMILFGYGEIVNKSKAINNVCETA